jgi:arabinofuranosyltransferase
MTRTDDVSTNTQLIARTGGPEDAPAGEVPDRRGRVLSRALVGGVVVAVLVLGWSRRWTSDDAFINFRVVEELLAGNGPVFNAGERVEVATSPLWLFVLTVGEAIVPGTAVPWISVVLGLVLTATAVTLAALAASRLWGRVRSLLLVPFGIAVFAALPPTWDFTTSGLETGLSFSWLALTFWGLVRWVQSDRPAASRPVWLLVLIGLGPLVRPDFAVITGILLLFVVVAGAGRWWQRLLGLAVAAVVPVAYQVFRMGYYGLLIPNTAVAKESSRPLWHRGFVYLADLVAPHLLWVPALIAVLLLAVLAPQARWQRRETALVLVVLGAAVVHALYVVRVGGDFMHARLLMPSVFLALCPVAVLPVTRRATAVSAALLVGAAVWAGASMAVLRIDYAEDVAPSGIADERGFYAMLAGVEHPVTLADHGGAGVSAYTGRVLDAARDGRDEIVLQVVPVRPSTPLEVLAPSSGGMVLSVGNAGFYGVAAGRSVFVIDGFGLTDPIASHIESGETGRPGHEKIFPSWYLLARYGAPELAEVATPGLPDPVGVALSREALSCGDAAQLIQATSGELTLDQFVSNIVHSPEMTAFRVPIDPAEARDQFC